MQKPKLHKQLNDTTVFKAQYLTVIKSTNCNFSSERQRVFLIKGLRTNDNKEAQILDSISIFKIFMKLNVRNHQSKLITNKEKNCLNPQSICDASSVALSYILTKMRTKRKQLKIFFKKIQLKVIKTNSYRLKCLNRFSYTSMRCKWDRSLSGTLRRTTKKSTKNKHLKNH